MTLKQYLYRTAAAKRAAAVRALKAESRAIEARGLSRRTARQNQIADWLRFEKSSLSGRGAVEWLGWDGKNVVKGGAPFTQAVTEWARTQGLEGINQAIELAKEYGYNLPSQLAQMRRELYAAVLENLSWAALVKLYLSPPQGIKLPPLWQFLWRVPTIQAKNISQFLGNAAIAVQDCMAAVRDTLEIGAEGKITRQGPAYLLDLKNGGDFRVEVFETDSVAAKPTIYTGSFEAQDRCTQYFEGLTPKYGASEDWFTVTASADFGSFPTVLISVMATFTQNSAFDKAKNGALSALKHG